MAATPHRALLFLYAETPVHAGGDTGLGALDLPIQREVSTGLPIIKGESLKGALREHTRPLLERNLRLTIFGAEPPRSGTASGALAPGAIRVHEAQLVAFPAPSLTDTFSWVTSPLVRARLARRAALAGITLVPDAANPGGERQGPDDTRCLTPQAGGGKGSYKDVVLGSYRIKAYGDRGFKDWAAAIADLALPGLDEHGFFRDKLARDIFLASDDLLKAVARECTTVVARVQLGAEGADGKPSKTVQHGPFYSEYLPAETLLVAMLETQEAAQLDALKELLNDNVVQIGGDETIGKGLMWCRMARPGTGAGQTR